MFCQEGVLANFRQMLIKLTSVLSCWNSNHVSLTDGYSLTSIGGLSYAGRGCLPTTGD